MLRVKENALCPPDVSLHIIRCLDGAFRVTSEMSDAEMFYWLLVRYREIVLTCDFWFLLSNNDKRYLLDIAGQGVQN